MRLPDLPSANRFRILVAEDDADTAHLVAVHLQNAGFEVFLAPDGEQAWHNFASINPHLLLTDIHMPGLSGHELIECVRAASPIPILIMAAEDADDTQILGFKEGADDYVPKPLHLKVLTARVIAHLRRVYRYDCATPATPATNEVVAKAKEENSSLPKGFTWCEPCGYLGPQWKFEAQNAQGVQISRCPHCGNRNVTFSIS